MGMPCNVAGVFKAMPYEWGVQETKGASVAVVIGFNLLELLDPIQKKWMPWGEKTQQVVGKLWVIGKSGNVRESDEQLARDLLNWDGDFTKLLTQGTLSPPSLVYLRTNPDKYNSEKAGKTVYEAGRMSLTLDGVQFAPDGVKSVAADQIQTVAERLAAKRAGTFVAPVEAVEPVAQQSLGEGEVPF